MKKVIFLICFIYLACFSLSAYACEPCGSTLDLNETIQQADLIIIGKKIKDGPHTDPRPEGYGGPDWIIVKIERVLKGKNAQDEIKVNSWDAMCTYGFAIDEKRYMMFLQKIKQRVEEGDFYDTVNYGCSVKLFPMKGDTVMMGMAELAIEDFIGTIILPKL